jgi:NTP pyrophosphatase (non-canonical NTP hydrolase)
MAIKNGKKGEQNMTINEYQEQAMRTSNQKLSTMEHIINGALGLAGESGEVADLVKKWTMQGHIIDANHLKKELGDVCWYIAETATAIGCTLEEIMQANIDKLRERYPDGFDPEKSQHRAKGDV